MAGERDDYDGPWKRALDEDFFDFLAMFFPEAYAAVDRSRPAESLDKELSAITPGSEAGVGIVDKLMRVWLRDGTDLWVLVHIEVQSQPDPEFAHRMYRYHYRLFDRFGARVASLAVLADSNPDWRPDRFEYELFGARTTFRFPIVKLLDFEEREAELLRMPNPFAILTVAHLRTMRTARDHGARYDEKLGLLRALVLLGMDPARIRRLFLLVDSLMRLPDELDRRLAGQLRKEPEVMPYVSSFERLAREDALKEGLEKGLEQGREQGRLEQARDAVVGALAARFGRAPEEVEQRLRRVDDLARLERLHREAVLAGSLDELLASLPDTAQLPDAPPPSPA